MVDGLPGTPLWRELPPATASAPEQPCPTPMLIGKNGRLYVLRETNAGPRVMAFSATGAFLQQFPLALQGITAVDAGGHVLWARPDEQGVSLVRYTPQGVERGWKRVPSPTGMATMLGVRTPTLWGWLTGAASLLKFDDTLSVVEQYSVLTPEGDRVERPIAIGDDGAGRIIIAVPGRLLAVKP
jgi:hypothetical protein